jgi:hypothetical protein
MFSGKKILIFCDSVGLLVRNIVEDWRLPFSVMGASFVSIRPGCHAMEITLQIPRL